VSVSAAERLERLLYILPAAAREGGAPVSELATALGVEARQVLRDVEELVNRDFYHTAGGAEDIQVTVQPDRVTIRTEEFRRPTRLSPREAAALGLALRVRASESDDVVADRCRALAVRLEAGLAALPDDALEEAVAVDPGVGADRGLRLVLEDACRARRVVEFRYVKPGEADEEQRRVRPYVLAGAEGHWYLLGWCERAEAVRAFRLDRMVEAGPTGPDGAFEVPEDFDPDAWLGDGRLFLPGEAVEEVEVAVRYSAAIARWILEREADAEAEADGAVVVKHRVADPDWLVRHVLQYGAEAEVIEPASMRARVRGAVGGG